MSEACDIFVYERTRDFFDTLSKNRQTFEAALPLLRFFLSVDIAAFFEVAAAGDNETDEFLIHIVVDFERDRQNKKFGFVAVPLDKRGIGDEAETYHIADPVGAF